jgi:hypothetical protein
VRQTVGIVDIFIAGEPTEHRLAEQPYQQMPSVLAAPTFCQHGPGQIGQPKCVVEFTVRKQSGVRGDTTAMELQPQTAVEIDPDGTIVRFTCWVSHSVEAMRCVPPS